jgi:hypothetical protein
MASVGVGNVAVGRSSLLLQDLVAQLFDQRATIPEGLYVNLCDAAQRVHEQLRIAQASLSDEPARDGYGAADGWGGGEGSGEDEGGAHARRRRRRVAAQGWADTLGPSSVPTVHIEGVGRVPMASLTG